MTGNTLVCVAVSLYNYARFLPECLESVAAQTHDHLELIIVDDQSTDGSVEVARAWLEDHQDRFKRVLLLQHLENQGLSQARNTAFASANAAYVFVLDADNEIYPRATSRLLETIEHTRAGVAYSQTELFGDRQGLGRADVWSRELFKSGNYVDAMALVAKEAWEVVGGYSHMSYAWEDYDFWCKFIEHGIRAVFVPEILCRYRTHRSSMTANIVEQRNAKLIRTIHEITARHPWLDIPIPESTDPNRHPSSDGELTA